MSQESLDKLNRLEKTNYATYHAEGVFTKGEHIVDGHDVARAYVAVWHEDEEEYVRLRYGHFDLVLTPKQARELGQHLVKASESSLEYVKSHLAP